MDHIRDRGRGLRGNAPVLSFLCHGLVWSENGSKRFTYKYILPFHTTFSTIQFSTVKPARNYVSLTHISWNPLPQHHLKFFPTCPPNMKLITKAPLLIQSHKFNTASLLFHAIIFGHVYRFPPYPIKCPTIQPIFITFITFIFLCISPNSHHISLSQFTSN